ncbi:MAG: stage II sporulation protein P [Oscillospiraceae bacterium]|nr:stage II sporulation protein P [Oscillospiraceae bacterium]
MKPDLSNRKKALTEFMAGGLLAFTMFLAVGLTVLAAYLSKDVDLSNFVELSNHVETPGNVGISNDVYLSDIVENLIGLEGTWAIDEAPEELEEPADESEVLSSPLPYPSEFNTLGGEIVRKTYSYSETSTVVSLPGGGMLRNSTDIDTEYLLEQADKDVDFTIDIDSGEPQVLIIHTHTTESYEPYARTSYDDTFNSRTTDLDKSVVAVGNEIAEALEAAGIAVIHDTELYDYPQYTGAYDRSTVASEAYLEEYPSIKIVIDVHRDAIESDGIRYAPICEIDGETAAQVMIIVGCLNVPNYRYNLRFAAKLQSKLETDYPGLTRPILFTERNYNQELTHASILIEVGSSANAIDEAIYAGRLVGMGLAELLANM